MKNVANIIASIEHHEVSIDNANPLILNDPEQVVVVSSGKADVFSMYLQGDKIKERLYPFFRAEANEILFGCEIIPDNGLSYLVKPTPGTTLIRFGFNELIEFVIEKPEYIENLSNATLAWINKIISGLKSGIDTPHLQEKLGVPLSPQDISNKITTGELANFLSTFQNLIAETLSAQHKDEDYQQHQGLKRKKAIDVATIQQSIKRLASVLHTGDDIETLQDGEDPTYQACRVIGKKIGIQFKCPPEVAHPTKDDQTSILEEIIRSSRVRSRKVILKNKWWKTDSSPMLGYLEETNTPVALLPHKSTGYTMFVSGTAETVRVTGKNAPLLQGAAHVFYRPFPDKSLHWKDLLSFGSFNIKKDITIIILMGIAGGLLGILYLV